MQTAARATSSVAMATSRASKGSLPLARDSWTRPRTVSLATMGTTTVLWIIGSGSGLPGPIRVRLRPVRSALA